MTKNLMSLFRWSPLLLLFNGWWMLSNPEIFENSTTVIETQIQGMKSAHRIAFKVDWATPILMVGIGAVFIVFVTKVFDEQLMEWGYSLQDKQIAVDEDLPNFFKCITLSQADQLVEEERNMEKHYLLQINDPDTVDRLDNTAMPSKSIQGTPWYTVHSNERYRDNFNYIGANVSEREKIIEDGQEDDLMTNDKMSERGIRVRCE